MTAFPHRLMQTGTLGIALLVLLLGSVLVGLARADVNDEGFTDSQCGQCHEEMAADQALSVHKTVGCLQCHPQAAEEDHEQVAATTCRQCHAPHDEKISHDAHSRLDCLACHGQGGLAMVDPASQRVVRNLAWPPHQAIQTRAVACANCHFSGNSLGAASMLLPAKSILCLPCHSATLTISDWTTRVSLAVFGLGMIGLVSLWWSGASSGNPHASGDGRHQVAAMVADGLFLRRLWRLSVARWVIHALIFYPILLRLIYGITALGVSLMLPDTELAAALLDKNHPFRALLFDLTGLMILIGEAAALLGLRQERPVVASLPVPGRAMTLLLGLIVLAGFFLESIRMAMTGWPAGASYAFVGYGGSLLLAGMTGLTDIYGYGWYAHAILTGAFVALIPFTRMRHMITAPMVLMAGARSQVQSDH